MELLYYIADKKGLLVGELEDNCPYTEYLRWIEFYRRRREEEKEARLQRTTDHYMFAKVCWWLARLNHIHTNDPKNPEKFTLTEEDFLSEFKYPTWEEVEEKRHEKEEAAREAVDRDRQRVRNEEFQRMFVEMLGVDYEKVKNLKKGETYTPEKFGVRPNFLPGVPIGKYNGR